MDLSIRKNNNPDTIFNALDVEIFLINVLLMLAPGYESYTFYTSVVDIKIY